MVLDLRISVEVVTEGPNVTILSRNNRSYLFEKKDRFDMNHHSFLVRKSTNFEIHARLNDTFSVIVEASSGLHRVRILFVGASDCEARRFTNCHRGFDSTRFIARNEVRK